MAAIDTINEQQYREQRQADLETLSSIGKPSYPHKFTTSIQFAEYRKQYEGLEKGSRHQDIQHSIVGRVVEKRNSGKNLVFYTVESDGLHLQILADKREFVGPHFDTINSCIKRGDIVGFSGFVGKSLRDELSLYAREIELLTPCFKVIPKLFYGLKDKEIRVRKRYLDLLSNPDSRTAFVVTSRVCKEIRRYLDDKDFLEVHTPILSNQVGGANAKPFVTHHNDLDQDMFLRIAPELYLKKLVVGGLNRVYELGKQFRNEGADTTHNPEFLSLEFYMANADYNDMMNMCEEMFTQIVEKVCGKLVVEYQPMHQNESISIDFTPPYNRLDITEELQKVNIDLTAFDLFSEEANQMLDQVCEERGIKCTAPRTTARLLDKLIGEYIEPQCKNPTFVMNHPLIMSPLAKHHRDNQNKPGMSERFELFVNGMEIANAYTELNMPEIQRAHFMEQQKAKNQGDDEAQDVDEGFLDALDYGLPPTGGFGCGIERIVMFLSNRCSIRDVIAFPALTKETD
jgi:lysyl-tRNA synthetase class 2